MIPYEKNNVKTWIAIALITVVVLTGIIVTYKIKPAQQKPPYRILYNEVTQEYRIEERRIFGRQYRWTIINVSPETPLYHKTLVEAEKAIIKYKQKIENERIIDNGWKTIKEIF